MTHLYRFFGRKIAPGEWELDEEEAVHVLKVLRLGTGTTVEVMDGLGLVGTGQLLIQSKRQLVVQGVIEMPPTLSPIVRALVLGALKGHDFEDILPSIVELGIDQILLYRSEGVPRFRLNDKADERWQRILKAAVKQSKRPTMPRVYSFDSLAEALDEVGSFQKKILFDPHGSPLLEQLITKSSDFDDQTRTVVTLVGGEKGLSDSELQQARSEGFEAVSLGPWILRARTAAIAAATFLITAYDDSKAAF